MTTGPCVRRGSSRYRTDYRGEIEAQIALINMTAQKQPGKLMASLFLRNRGDHQEAFALFFQPRTMNLGSYFLLQFGLKNDEDVSWRSFSGPKTLGTYLANRTLYSPDEIAKMRMRDQNLEPQENKQQMLKAHDYQFFPLVLKKNIRQESKQMVTDP